MPITKKDIEHALTQVVDPELQRDLVALGAVVKIAYCDGIAGIELELNNRPAELLAAIKDEVATQVRSLSPEIKTVNVEIARAVSLGMADDKPKEQQKPQEQQSPQDQAKAENPLPGVKHVIAVGAGKGGVGKSSIAVNMAVGLARRGHTVGILDGDIYGPSLPTMLGLEHLQPEAHGNMIIPFEVHGVRAMTLGSLVEDDKPLIWRGPMAHGAFRQLATQTAWGDLDYLIIDLPPGTGDVPLTLAQLLPLTGAVVVCTPQKVAQDDAKRAVAMFRQLGVEVLGLVENMSYFIGDDGKEYDIFGKGGAELLAMQTGIPFLGTVPINTRIRLNADAGDPTANYIGDDQLAKELDGVVGKTLEQVNAFLMSEASQGPTLTVS